MDTEQFLIALGVVIRRRRKRLGYSQEDLAGAANLHRNYVGAIERGSQNVSVKSLISICGVLGLPLSMLTTLAEAELLPQRRGDPGTESPRPQRNSANSSKFFPLDMHNILC